MVSRILIFAALFMTIVWQSLTAESALTVAWVENENLMIWHEGDNAPAQAASGTVQMAFLAPDGEHVAFIRGTQYRYQSLWVVKRDGTDERELASPEVLNGNLIVRVGWLDNTTLYFNSAEETEVWAVPQDDLWRADITSTAERLLAPGEGGNFTFSPDHQHIVLVLPGKYDGKDGSVSLLNPQGEGQRELLTFPAIGTGSEYRLYPPIFWEADSSALRLAIPEKDLVYDDTTGVTAMWRLALDGTQENLGTVQASFFGSPLWSFDGQWMIYLRRVGDINNNQFELVTAAGDGSESAVYTTGEAGSFQLLGWLPGDNHFLYAQDGQGFYWLGSPGGEPQRLPGKIFVPSFVSPTRYLYTTAGENTFELRSTDLTNPESFTVITTFDIPIPVFSAVLS